MVIYHLKFPIISYNKYSLKSFLDLGYEIKKDKLKYGGLRRYVVAKKLQK